MERKCDKCGCNLNITLKEGVTSNDVITTLIGTQITIMNPLEMYKYEGDQIEDFKRYRKHKFEVCFTCMIKAYGINPFEEKE